MGNDVTIAGELTGEPEYVETERGKAARLHMCVRTKRRVEDDWIDDPPVIYEIVVTDDEGLGLVATLRPGDRVLVSGTASMDVTPPVVEAETLALSVRFQGRN